MDFYKILNINKDAKDKDIKKAYRKLALLYHPDKNKTNKNINKFHQIKLAYDTLIDKDKREEYDLMSNIEREKLYNLIDNYIKNISPEYNCLYENVINSLYNDKIQFEEDINNFNFIGIYKRLKEKINTNYNNWFESKKPDIININDNKKKVINIECSVEQKYNDLYKEIIINQKKIVIPLRESQVYYNNYIVNIVPIKDTEYKIKDDINILIVKNISLYEYLFGGSLNFIYFDNSNIKIDFNGNISKNPIYTIKGKGLPYTYINNEDDIIEYKISDSIIKRGDLLIKLNVLDLEKYKDEIKKLN